MQKLSLIFIFFAEKTLQKIKWNWCKTHRNPVLIFIKDLAGGCSSIDWKFLNNDWLLFCFWKLVIASRYPKPLVPLEKPAEEVESPETTSEFGTVEKTQMEECVCWHVHCIRPAGCWFDRLPACLFWCIWHVLLQEIKVHRFLFEFLAFGLKNFSNPHLQVLTLNLTKVFQA